MTLPGSDGSPERSPAGDTPAGSAAEATPERPPAGDAPAGDAPAGDAPAQEAAAEARVEDDLEALLSERDEYLDLAKRTKADFENYRKRMGSEVQAAATRGKADLVREVLPVLDDLERAIQAAGLDPEGDSPDGLAHGVLLVFRSLREALARNGVEAVDPHGERFDPNLHEALSKQQADGADPGTVVEVMQKGYRLGEYLVRPARVVVAE
jgi:molecular chaperone GrpE